MTREELIKALVTEAAKAKIPRVKPQNPPMPSDANYLAQLKKVVAAGKKRKLSMADRASWALSKIKGEEEEYSDTVVEGIFAKLKKRKMKMKISDTLTSKQKRQMFKAHLKKYGLNAKGKPVIEAIINEITISNDNVGSTNRASYSGGGKLGGGFGSRGNNPTRFTGGGKQAQAYMGGNAGRVSGAGKLGGGFGTTGSDPGRMAGVSRSSVIPTPRTTSGGRMGGGDRRPSPRTPSPGNTRPGTTTGPSRRPNPRGGMSGGRQYGGNRQYSGSSRSSSIGGRFSFAGGGGRGRFGISGRASRHTSSSGQYGGGGRQYGGANPMGARSGWWK